MVVLESITDHGDRNDRRNSHLTDSETNSVLTANACIEILQVVSVKLSNDANSLETLAVCDPGSTLCLKDSGFKSSLSIDGTKLTLSVAAINGTKDMTSEKVSVKVYASTYVEILAFHVHPKMYFVKCR